MTTFTTIRHFALLAMLGCTFSASTTLGAEPPLVAIKTKKVPQAPGTWTLQIKSSVPLGHGAVGVVNATSFTPHEDISDTFSCLSQVCASVGPGHVGEGVVPNAVYVAWAAYGTPDPVGAYGPSEVFQPMGTIEASVKPVLTFSGVSTVYGGPEEAPLSEFYSFENISQDDIKLDGCAVVPPKQMNMHGSLSFLLGVGLLFLRRVTT